MSRTGTATRLALRELWMTYRLVVMLVGLVGAGAVVALLPAPLPTVLERLAIGLAGATILAAALAAWSVAGDRRHGRSAWLVSRSVPRGSLIGSWFVVIAAVVVLGVASASLLGWFAGAAVARIAIVDWVAVSGGVAATAVAAVALGCVIGLLLRPWPAAIVTVIATATTIGAAWLLPVAPVGVPGDAFVALAAAEAASARLPASARNAGVALLVTAVLLVIGRGLAERVDL